MFAWAYALLVGCKVPVAGIALPAGGTYILEDVNL